uniref:Probable transport protein n=1 Tax=Koliella corcontica TaxID=155904 RepID=A0A097KMR0_9CHLO|nr:probable transport protein [Koliella corcontica]AIT94476.1 probable transport protein [Koliella corcontica]
MSILIENVSKNYFNSKVLDHVFLEVKKGSVVALLGPSGSGKSTLLKTIAGLESIDSGRIWLTGKNTNLISIQEREIGFVFQNYALFNNMTVYDNVAFGLKLRKTSLDYIYSRVKELLEFVNLEEFVNYYPNQLSGGQKQRVALARALAIEPKYLLLDEPFGALDLKTRKELRYKLRKLNEDLSLTTLIVTHDKNEAIEVANEIIVFEKGRVHLIINPSDIFELNIFQNYYNSLRKLKKKA